ncbi:LOW QUALITY PROTEIN: hypothetical protein HID58_081335, partial [Brassica napus]
RFFLNATSAIHFYFNNESGKSYLERTCGIGKGSTSGPTKYGGVKKIEKRLLIFSHSFAYESHRSTRPTGLGPSKMLKGDCWVNFNLLFKHISLQLHYKITEFHSCILNNKSTTNVLPSIFLRSSWSI